MIEQEASDGDSVIRGSCRWKPAVTEMEQRRPKFLSFAEAPSSLWSTRLARGFRPCSQNAFDFVRVTAHNGRMNAVARNLRKAFQHAQGSIRASHMSCWSIRQDGIGARVLEKRRRQLSIAINAPSRTH
jgi:hypothetical protein